MITTRRLGVPMEGFDMTNEFFETYEKAINVAKQKFGSEFRALRITHWEKDGHTLCEVFVELKKFPMGLKLSDIHAGQTSVSGAVLDPTFVLERLIEKLEKEAPE